MKQRLKPLFESDGKNKYREWTFENVMERLKCIRREVLNVAGIPCRTVSEPEEDQQRILDLLGVTL